MESRGSPISMKRERERERGREDFLPLSVLIFLPPPSSPPFHLSPSLSQSPLSHITLASSIISPRPIQPHLMDGADLYCMAEVITDTASKKKTKPIAQSWVTTTEREMGFFGLEGNGTAKGVHVHLGVHQINNLCPRDQPPKSKTPRFFEGGMGSQMGTQLGDISLKSHDDKFRGRIGCVRRTWGIGLRYHKKEPPPSPLL